MFSNNPIRRIGGVFGVHVAYAPHLHPVAASSVGEKFFMALDGRSSSDSVDYLQMGGLRGWAETEKRIEERSVFTGSYQPQQLQQPSEVGRPQKEVRLLRPVSRAVRIVVSNDGANGALAPEQRMNQPEGASHRGGWLKWSCLTLPDDCRNASRFLAIARRVDLTTNFTCQTGRENIDFLP